MSETLLEVDNLRVAYDGVPAVHGVSLDVGRGEVVALVGANGAGKSSTLRGIAGEVRPVEGHVRLADKPIDKLRAHEIVAMGIAHVPEARRLFGPLTVEENLRLGAHHVRDKNVVHERLAEVQELFPVLRQRRTQRAETLSGGEQQMAAVARGLMSKPQVLLLDEPSLGVMPTVVDQLYDLVGQLAERGVSVVVADQNLDSLLRLADRAYVLRTGAIVMQGTGEELLHADEVREAYLGL